MVKLTFYGGAQEVTGSCFLFESDTAKILVDCGLFQCAGECAKRNEEPFLFDPASVSALFITHAHLDHVGLIPKLVKDGFRGKIYSTPPTKDLAELNLKDSLNIMEKEAKRGNDNGEAGGKKFLYSQEDLARALKIWETRRYGEAVAVSDFKIILRDSGHILGSAIFEIQVNGKKIYVTGDLGNSPTPLLRPTYEVRDADYLVMEALYGDRLHETQEERKLKLERAIEDAMKAGGTLMIPAFSLERTQELLFELNNLVEHGRIPQVPVFVDSPLAIHATEVYKKHEDYFNKEAAYLISSGDDIFKFPGLRFTLTTEESKSINEVLPPKIVIAGSGMSTGGRILHHERRYLSDPKSTLLLIGYQAAGTLGRHIQDGAKTVTIFGEEIPARAKIVAISGYSAHPDSAALFRFAERSVDTLKKILLVQGEPKSLLFMAQKVKDYLGIEAIAPRYKDSVELK
ncbi:MAG: MBL fold metallo-hydrolase [Candidatus Niyogibacteria bacterium]|nr:MBL fold metallo-hydrolase [Candidatus Niyogibacteria bacterium]